MKNILTVFTFIAFISFSNKLSAQCTNVTLASDLKTCIENGTTPITLGGDIDLTGFTITRSGSAQIVVNMGPFNITWTGTPWNVNGSATITFNSSVGSVVVSNTGAGTAIDPSQLNATASLTAAILPIELARFSATVKGNGASNLSVVLSFATATERNNAWFLIERSADGRVFTEIGKVKGAGNASTLQQYEFTDLRPLQGTSYYRLKQVDFDGQFSYSDLRSVVIGRANALTVSPSPAKDAVRVQLENRLTADATWQVLDFAGRIVLSGNIAAENNTVDMNVSTLMSGNYVLRIVGTEQNVTKQFYKQ